MTEEGEFVLNEPYASVLKEARQRAMKAWCTAICDYVAEHSSYEPEYLFNELLRIVNEREDDPEEMVSEFVVKALEGEL